VNQSTHIAKGRVNCLRWNLAVFSRFPLVLSELRHHASNPRNFAARWSKEPSDLIGGFSPIICVGKPIWIPCAGIIAGGAIGFGLVVFFVFIFLFHFLKYVVNMMAERIQTMIHTMLLGLFGFICVFPFIYK
jgi:hypothetical protein